MKRRGFIGSCVAAISGLFAAGAAASVPKDDLSKQLSKLQLMTPGHYPGLDKEMEEWRKKNPYTYTDAEGTYRSRDTYLLSKKPKGGIAPIYWGDQKVGDVVLVMDRRHNYAKNIINQTVAIEAHICLSEPDLYKHGAPIRCENISLDAFAEALRANMAGEAQKNLFDR